MTETARPLVSVILVNFHSAEDTARAITALRAAEPQIPFEVIVVDNASGRDDAAVLGRLSGVRIEWSADNQGFGRAVNRGAAIASGEHLLLLNPDVVARPGALAQLLAAADAHPKAAVLVPRLVNPDGSLQLSARTFYRWRTVLVRRTPLARFLASGRENRRHLMREWDHSDTREVDWAIGACWLVRRRDFVDLGGFDPRFFLYFEDVDLCLRAWRSGRSVLYVGASVFAHAHRRSSAGRMVSRAKLEHLRSMFLFRAKHGGWPGRSSLGPRRPMVFVNEAHGALAVRAERFAEALQGSVLAKDGMVGGRARRALASSWRVLEERPRHLHVLDVGVASLLVLVAARLAGARAVLDTGDEHYEVRLRTAHQRGFGLALAGVVERLCLGVADRIVARGRGHIAALAERGFPDVEWIPDGADVDVYQAAAPDPWRAKRGWGGHLVVASVGSLIIDARYRETQGSDLIEALAGTQQVVAAVVGDGPGRALLEDRARALGVGDRVHFFGWRPPAELPSLLKSFDVCISTLSNDAVGRARTTGKLPLFLASGRYVLASAVGEATRVLPAEMLVPYSGSHDPDYPRRLGARLAALERDRERLRRGSELVAVARQLFDYPRLAERVMALAGGGDGVVGNRKRER